MVQSRGSEHRAVQPPLDREALNSEGGFVGGRNHRMHQGANAGLRVAGRPFAIDQLAMDARRLAEAAIGEVGSKLRETSARRQLDALAGHMPVGIGEPRTQLFVKLGGNRRDPCSDLTPGNTVAVELGTARAHRFERDEFASQVAEPPSIARQPDGDQLVAGPFRRRAAVRKAVFRCSSAAGMAKMK